MFLRVPPSLKHRKFTYLWLGLMISIAGSQMQLAAIHWHIRELTGEPDPLALGGIGLARILPVIVFSLIGGSLADSFNRRTILFITQTAMALTAIGLAWMTITHSISVGAIYALTALQAVAVSFDGPARQSLVPNLVPTNDLPNAFSMTSIAFNAGAILGPAVSGFVIAAGGLQMVYLFNAVSFGAVILALLLIGEIPQSHAAQRPSFSFKTMLPDIRAGIEFIGRSPIILSTMLLDFFATFFSSANTMMPIIARDILHTDEVGYGLLASAQSIGSVSAALAISQMSGIRRQGQVFLSSVVVFGLATIGLGFSTNFALAIAFLVLIGASDSVSTIIRNTIRQLATPDHIRGRMTSINQIFFMGGPQLGEVEAGVVAQFFGVPFAIISGGLGCILAVFAIVRRWPEIAEFDGSERPAEAAA
ncbi:MAG: MFS transporter [Chloroflexota bacterium]